MPDDKDLNFDALRAVAKAATEGPWLRYHGKLRPQFSTIINEIQDDEGVAIVAWGGFDAARTSVKQRDKNAAFIATFNPALMLRLLDLAQREYERGKGK